MTKKVKKLNLVFKWSKQKKDFLFVLLLSLSLFLWDVAMNKVVDLGIDYNIHIIDAVEVPAILMMYIGGFGILIFLSLLFMDAVRNRKGVFIYDYFVGSIGFICFAFLLLGGILQVLHIEQFPLLVWEVYTITAYHLIAIGGFILTMIYFVITE